MPTKNNKQDWNWHNSYLELPEKLYSKQAPSPVPEPSLIYWNEALAEQLGLEFLTGSDEKIAELFSGNATPPGAEPLAQAYAGHQFGGFNILGDGRAILLGEQITPEGKRFDIQLKGSGQTPYSRRGDGRATLSSMLREYLISEAMYHLGIPTTRSLAVVGTGQPVYRQKVNQGAVLTRIASSHIRVGTFEYVRQYGTSEEIEAFVQYVIKRHYPELDSAENKALALLEAVMDKQIELVVEWMRVGFIHGVMNTDNVSIAGETIDYGPCAFMNAYDPRTVFSSIDRHGRYAFGNQPNIAHWNMAVFAGTLLPLIAEQEEEATELARTLLDEFPRRFAQKWYQMMFRKLGIVKPERTDAALVDELLELMERHQADYTNVFTGLRNGQLQEEALSASFEFQDWHTRWKKRFEATPTEANALMIQSNPVVIARNHLVEEVLQAAEAANYEPLNDLLAQLAAPYANGDEAPKLQLVPSGFDSQYQTFCGT